MRYIALLRGINVGGNNRVPMPELKECFEGLGHKEVSTYINSGNVIFESSVKDKEQLVRDCEQAIQTKFGFHVVCAIILATELHKALADAPSWWDKNPKDKHNALFVIAPATAQQIMDEAGEPKPEYEKIACSGPVIFWTAPLATFSRTRYHNIVGTKAYKSITIRNANTTKKLAELTS